MADVVKEKPPKKEKKSKQLREGRNRDVSASHYMDDMGHHDDNMPRIVTMENTYQLGPTDRFPISNAFKIIQEIVTTNLQDEKYELHRARELSLNLCLAIKNRVKDMSTPRYRIAVLLHIGQLFGQSMQISSRCLWDPSFDTFTSFSFKNRSLFCVASVYAVYFE